MSDREINEREALRRDHDQRYPMMHMITPPAANNGNGSFASLKNWVFFGAIAVMAGLVIKQQDLNYKMRTQIHDLQMQCVRKIQPGIPFDEQ